MSTINTVGDLRQLIADLPDDMPVKAAKDGNLLVTFEIQDWETKSRVRGYPPKDLPKALKIRLG